jgi:anionic cell wall polymer biosynthesis LytR-Cps2A-Psr (LCP) family protein
MVATMDIIVNIIKKHKIKIVMLVIIILVIAIAMTLITNINRKKVEVDNSTESDYHSIIYNDENYMYNSSVISILFMGIDKSSSSSEQGQADVLELLLLNRNAKTIQCLSIPRDTITDIRVFDFQGNDLGWNNDHISLAYSYGKTAESGCMYEMQAVSRLMSNVPITRYAAVNINLLSQVQGFIGDFDVVIPNDSLEYLNKEWKKGNTITITTKNVESFIRSRDTDVDYSNNDRIERQETYLKGAFKEIKKLLETDFDNSLNQLYNLIKSTTTNISYSDMESLANLMLTYEFDEDSSYSVLKGENTNDGSYDEFIVNKDDLLKQVIDLFYKKED